jgi:hypothetical protein
MVHRLRTLVAVAVMGISTHPLIAQKSEIPVKEFAVRLIPMNYIDFVFKHEKKEDRIRRFRLMATSLAFTSGQQNTSVLANLGFAYGLEKRKDVGVNTYFMHGWEPYVIANLNQGNKYLIGQLTLGVGYVVGFTHNFSKGFAMGIEAIPSFSTNRTIASKPSSPQPLKLNANFSMSAVAISFVYRIQ